MGPYPKSPSRAVGGYERRTMGQKAIILGALTLVASALNAGCAPFIEVEKVDAATAQKLRTQVPVYAPEDVKGRNYKVLQQIDATSCKHLLWDPNATPQDATDQLRLKAARLEANGLLSLSCGGVEGSFEKMMGTNCWETITCKAAVIELR